MKEADQRNQRRVLQIRDRCRMRLKYRSEVLWVICLSNVQLEKVRLVHAKELPPGLCPFIRVVESAGAQRLQAGCDLGVKPQGRPALATKMRNHIPASVGGKAI